MKRKDSYNISFGDEPVRGKIRLLPLILAILAILIIAGILFGVATFIKIGKEVEGIYISKTPAKTAYYVGEKAVFDDLIVIAVCKNGKSHSINIEDCAIFGFDSSKATEKQVITVNFNGFLANFAVSVEEIPGPTPTLVGISLETMPKTQYKVGDWLDTDGGVLLRTYDNGEVKRINLINGYVRGFAKVDGPGEYVMTVEYTEGMAFFTLEYTITVTE